MYKEYPKFYNHEILDYGRKSRTDDPLLSVEEVLDKHDKIIEEYANKHFGGPIPEENKYREVGSAESLDSRPEILRLLKAVENPGIKGVAVVEVQRLSRGDLEDAGRLIRILRYTNTYVITPMKIYDLRDDMYRQRARYEEEEEEPRAVVAPAPKRRPEAAKTRIDIPLDDEISALAASPAEKEKTNRVTGFFRHKEAHVKTPDQVLLEKNEEKAATKPLVVPAIPDVPEEEFAAPVPVTPPPAVKPAAPVPLPIEPDTPSARKEKATTAKEVAAQTAAVYATL